MVVEKPSLVGYFFGPCPCCFAANTQTRQVLEVVAGCKGITDIDQLSKTLYHNTCSCSQLDFCYYHFTDIRLSSRVFFPHDLDSAADALLSSGMGPK
ncbi:TatD related DNase [Actinidia rufa]|uniref:TatD related DNase n=1 Tax=Actinidia rufa TaxID=165716 RepID=A0A7J0FHR5_9ERIC|nr:TatD related DNase [Actinidia rufa]